MLTMKPWDDIVEIGSEENYSSSLALKKVSKVDENANCRDEKSVDANTLLLQSYTEKYFKEIVHLLGSVPSELLLLFKTNDCLRHLDRLLGTPINTSSVIARVTANIILKEDIDDMTSKFFRSTSVEEAVITLGNMGVVVLKWVNINLRLVGLNIISNYIVAREYFKGGIEKINSIIGYFNWFEVS